MDLTGRPQIIKKYLTDLVGSWDDYNARQDAEYLSHRLLFDDHQGSYLVLRYGWVKEKYLYSVSIHIDLVSDAVWIQCNNTEEEIVDVLSRSGIPADDIVLGFIPPEYRGIYTYGAG